MSHFSLLAFSRIPSSPAKNQMRHRHGKPLDLHRRPSVEQLEDRTVPTQLVNTALTATALAQSLVGSGVSVSNATFTGAPAANGSFNFSDPTVVGFGQGIVLSSGNAASVVGPNTSDSTSTDWGLPGDTQLTALSGFQTHDAAVLEFDFTPVANQVVFNYTFASDEYPEWAATPFNDVFGFYVNGTDYATVRQVAGDPASPFVPVAVNNINNGNPVIPTATPMRPDLFRANYFNSTGPSAIDLELDGITTVLTFQAPVTPGVTNHMRLAIADSSDGIYDSAVFIQAASFNSNERPVASLSVLPPTGPAPLTVAASVEGTDPNNAPLSYTINWGDGTFNATGALPQNTALVNHTFAASGTYVVTLTVSNGILTGTSTENVIVTGSLAAPVVTGQPTSQSVFEGNGFTFSASASGTPTPAVQWQVSTDGGLTYANILGATSTTYSATATATQDGNLYHAVFTNSQGTATTDPALLSVASDYAAPVVVSNPTTLILHIGVPFAFTAAATGVPAPTVQWQVSTDSGATFQNIPGATATTYSGTSSTSIDGDQYRAVFTNSQGSATTTAALLVVDAGNVPPIVTGQPTSKAVLDGELFTFSAAATGIPVPTAQWQVSTNGGVSFTNIPGATDTTYSAVASVSENGNLYRAVFDNGEGTATTNSVTLTVTPQATTTLLTDNGPTPSIWGDAVSFTASVSGGSVITGETVFIEDASNGNAVVAAPTLAGGTVTFTISNLSVGTHALFAVYNGNPSHFGSNSSLFPVTQVVNPSGVTPRVSTVEVNGGTPEYLDSNNRSVSLAGQNSVVEQLLVTFNEAVTLDPGTFSIANNAAGVTVLGGAAAPNNLAVNTIQTSVAGSGNTQWIVTFSGPGTTSIPGGLGNLIKDGLYILNTDGSKVHANGLTAPDNHADFWALFGSVAADNILSSNIGDGTSDVFVDTPDAAQFKIAFGTENDSSLLPDQAYDAAMDSNLSGVIGTEDAAKFKHNFGTEWMF